MCEMEKPKTAGCADMRRLRSVDLPTPEGPERTMGRGLGGGWSVEEVVGAMVEVVVVVVVVESGRIGARR